MLVMNRAATVSTRSSVLRGESRSDAARTQSKSLRIFTLFKSDFDPFSELSHSFSVET